MPLVFADKTEEDSAKWFGEKLLVGPIYVFIGFLVAVVEAFLVYKVVRNNRRARLLRRLPLSRIGDLQAGLAKVEGRAVAVGRTLLSPLAERECVYYRFQVQEKRRRHGFPHGGSGYWKTVIDDAQAADCAIDDGTGSAVFRLQSAELALDTDDEERSGFLNDARPELEEILQHKYGYSTVGLIFNRTLYYSETRIEEGDDLLVLGTARQTENDGWEIVRADGPLLVSSLGLAALRASYRNAAIGWWFLAVLVLAAAGVAVAALSIHK